MQNINLVPTQPCILWKHLVISHQFGSPPCLTRPQDSLYLPSTKQQLVEPRSCRHPANRFVDLAVGSLTRGYRSFPSPPRHAQRSTGGAAQPQCHQSQCLSLSLSLCLCLGLCLCLCLCLCLSLFPWVRAHAKPPGRWLGPRRDFAARRPPGGRGGGAPLEGHFGSQSAQLTAPPLRVQKAACGCWISAARCPGVLHGIVYQLAPYHIMYMLCIPSCHITSSYHIILYQTNVTSHGNIYSRPYHIKCKHRGSEGCR